MRLPHPVRSMTAAANGSGYWMVADDGGIFAFNVPFEGSLPGVRSSGAPYVPSVRMRALPEQRRLLHARPTVACTRSGRRRPYGSSSGPAVDAMLAR